MSHRHILATSAFALLLTACGGGGKQDNPGTPEAGQSSTAARTSVLAANDPDCPNGGILVETGIDSNGNGVLDNDEVDNAEKVCNGIDSAPRYAVGGSLDSYRGDGLMLVETVSGQVFYAAQGSTDYAFSLEDGSQYNIIVGKQPESPTEICNISNGSGTVAGAAVADVAVTCTPGFTVGGGVYGLNSVGLVLQNNGTDDLDVVGHGFEFTTPLVDGSAYDVRIQRQPGTQDCTVSNGSGTLAGGDVTSVEVTCRNWRVDTLIETDNSGSATDPEVAIDALGNALVVWSQSDGTRYNIWASRYTVGSGWGEAELIETDNAGDASGPQIAIDASGNGWAVWSQSDGGTSRNIWLNRYTAGSGWGEAELIGDGNAGRALSPQIAVNASGDALVVWVQSDGTGSSGNHIWARRHTNNQWGTAVAIENVGFVSSPRIVMDASGNAIAVWRRNDGADVYNIWANQYMAGNGWETAAPIDSGNNGDVTGLTIVANASGNAVVAWRRNNSAFSQFDNWANYYTVGSGWGSATLIEASNDIAYPAEVVIDSSGNALAVWYQRNDAGNYSIWSNRYSADNGWSTEIPIADEGFNSKIAMDGSGNVLMVYKAQGGFWTNRYMVDSGWGSPKRSDTISNQGPGYRRIAMNASGNAVAVSLVIDIPSYRYDVWANRYE